MTRNRALIHQAESIAAPLPPLLAAAERVASTVALGVHGRRQVGRGETFWQFRRYQAGDPASLIDWRQSARSKRVYVRETEWEAAQTVWLWSDPSPSMIYRSDKSLPEKRDRATVLLLALAMLLTQAGERTAVLGVPGSFGAGFDPERLARRLRPESGPGLPAETALPPYARAVLASDFLTPIEEITRVLRHLTTQQASGHLLLISDPAEESLPFDGRVDFHGLEGEATQRIGRVQSVRDDYRAAVEAHRAELAVLVGRFGWTLIEHRTDHPPETALMALYESVAARPEGA